MRLSLKRKAEALLSYKQSGDKNAKYLIGIDAAANELDASPDVFAPVFKFLRKSELFRFTYHVGEDFRHLISGIRAIDEAVEFLDMHIGDRLGHCTALGIEPSIWSKHYIGKTYIPRGEWLFNLVWTWDIINTNKECANIQYLIPKIEIYIMRYSQEIFEKIYSPFELLKSWKFRKHDPNVYLKENRNYYYSSDIIEDYEEWEDITHKLKSNEYLDHINYMYYKYKPSRQKYDEYIKIEDDELFDCDFLRIIQCCELKKIISKGIIIETLPSSNYCISQYEEFDEYHFERWINEKEMYNPTLVIGTDDPGIFSTNIYNEYSRIFLYLKRKNYPVGTIMQRIKEIQQNSKNYSFGI
ncbi:hypothetical protein [Prevotella sp.]|uniref:hypothetical protein n=1 Tax=Prevotella sp. TaxID=59823 RepID=UPI003DA639B6